MDILTVYMIGFTSMTHRPVQLPTTISVTRCVFPWPIKMSSIAGRNAGSKSGQGGADFPCRVPCHGL